MPAGGQAAWPSWDWGCGVGTGEHAFISRASLSLSGTHCHFPPSSSRRLSALFLTEATGKLGPGVYTGGPRVLQDAWVTLGLAFVWCVCECFLSQVFRGRDPTVGSSMKSQSVRADKTSSFYR